MSDESGRSGREEALLRPEATLRVAPAATPGPEALVQARIERLFAVDQGVRDVVTTQMASRNTASRAVQARAKRAFRGFTPSRFSAEERADLKYLAPGDDLLNVHEQIVTAGADDVRSAPPTGAIRIRDGSEIAKKIERDGGTGRLDLEELVRYVAGKHSGSPVVTDYEAQNPWHAELEAERMIAAIEGTEVTPRAGEGAGELPGAPAASDGNGVAALVHEEVNLQMGQASPPESQVRFMVPSRSDQGEVQESVDTFELRAGASDVTSYHDFTTVQIAFQSVWTEVFDGQLAKLGQELYGEWVKLKQFAGDDAAANRGIDTIDDLRRLMDEVKSLSTRTADAIPLQPEGGGTSGDGHMSSGSGFDLFKEVSKAAEDAAEYVDEAGKGIAAAFDNLLSGKRQITWDSFPGPLPGPYKDVITTKFDHGVAADGTVEIILEDVNHTRSPWKGIAFIELDSAGRTVAVHKITNDWLDTDVWNAASYNKLTLSTPRLKNGVLEFDEEGFGQFHYGFYLLGDLHLKLFDKSRVTFTW
jgi:hypothetical protein